MASDLVFDLLTWKCLFESKWSCWVAVKYELTADMVGSGGIRANKLGEMAQGMSLRVWRRDLVPEPWALYHLQVNKEEAEPAEGKILEKF